MQAFVTMPLRAEGIAPVSVHRLRTADAGVSMLGATDARLTSGGQVLVWGDADEITRDALNLVDLTTGRQERLYKGLGPGTITATPSETGVWFFRDDPDLPVPELLFIDLNSRHVVRARDFFGDSFNEVETALRRDRYYFKTEAEPDGTLLLEWETWPEISILFGRTRSAWKLDPRPGNRSEVYSRAFLAAPTVSKSIRLEVGYEPRLHTLKQHRYEPRMRIEGKVEWLPTNGVIGPTLSRSDSSGNLRPLAVAGTVLRIQPFELLRHSKTLEPCKPGDDVVGRSRGFVLTTNVSSERCARFSGVYVERADTGQLIHALTHDIGLPGVKALTGHLLLFAGDREVPFSVSSASLWDIRNGQFLGRLELPPDVARQTRLVFIAVSPDGTRVHGVTGYPDPIVATWPLTNAAQLVAKSKP